MADDQFFASKHGPLVSFAQEGCRCGIAIKDALRLELFRGAFGNNGIPRRNATAPPPAHIAKKSLGQDPDLRGQAARRAMGVLISIPPTYAVSQVIGLFKRKGAIHIARV